MRRTVKIWKQNLVKGHVKITSGKFARSTARYYKNQIEKEICLETTEQEQEQAYEISFNKNYRKCFKIIAKNEDEAMRNAEALYNAGAIVFSKDDCYAFSVDLSGRSKDLKG